MENEILSRLKIFRQKEKFSDSEWNKRGLNPSNSELVEKMDFLLNESIDEIIENHVKNSSKSTFTKTLKRGLSKFNKADYDTEEKEFILDNFHELSNILGIDFKDNLNSWLYGSVLNTLLKLSNLFRSPQKVIETLVQNCQDCESKLETFITQKRSDITYESYNIVKCKTCGGYNLIELGKEIAALNFGNYEITEQLSKEDFSKEQAEIRLNQIRFFRK
jgi:Domain of unknown function (DUF4844)